jgi:anti-sigma factor RsiW
MKGCGHWQDAIADCALGNTPEPELAAHLASCPRCESALRESREMAARIDAALHRRAAVEPPLYGPERAMARIRGQADAGPLWSAYWSPRWRRAGVGGAVLAVAVAAIHWVHRPAPRADVTALSAWRSPTQALLQPPVAAGWTVMPQLGKGFFEMKPTGDIHEQ